MTKRVVGVMLLSLAGAGAWAQEIRRPAANEQQRQAAQAKVERRRMERDALRALATGFLSLDEAARAAGGYLKIDASPNPDFFPILDLATLSQKSELVIVGRPYGKPSVEPSDDRRSVVTQFDIQVDEVLRGRSLSQLAAMVVTLEVPGGRLAFDDGAVVEAVNGPEIRVGDRYLLYLQSKASTSTVSRLDLGARTRMTDEVYIPAGRQREGIFRVSGNAVVSLAPAMHALKRLYDGWPVVDFLAEARVSKYPINLLLRGLRPCF